MATAPCAHLDSVQLDQLPPEVPGCEDCLRTGDGWVHLRICLTCGHVGCCDSSPAQHATAHWHATGHPVVQSFEPGESWFWNYDLADGVDGPQLAPPTSRPSSQPTPGPQGRVPEHWTRELHR